MWWSILVCLQLCLVQQGVDGWYRRLSSIRVTSKSRKSDATVFKLHRSNDLKMGDLEDEYEYLFSSLEPKWFRRRYLDFKPGGVISSTTREGLVDEDETVNGIPMSPLSPGAMKGVKYPPNIRKLAIFPFDDGQAFPTGIFPMNIFVMKYRMMINDVYSSSDKVFGIVYSDGAGGFCATGTSVEIQERDMQSDGRQVLFTVCRSRFKILRILQEEPYMICEVDYGVPDLDVYMSQEGTPPPPTLPRSPRITAATPSDAENTSGASESMEVPVQGELSPYLCQLEKEVYQALCDVIALANKKNIGGAETVITKSVLDLSPERHPFRLTVATDFSFAMSDMLGCDPKLKQLLLESDTLELRLRRLRALLVGTRDYLYEQLQEEEPFG